MKHILQRQLGIDLHGGGGAILFANETTPEIFISEDGRTFKMEETDQEIEIVDKPAEIKIIPRKIKVKFYK